MNLAHRSLLLWIFLSLFFGLPASSAFAQSTVPGTLDPSRRIEMLESPGYPGPLQNSEAEVYSQLEEENLFAPASAGDRDLGEQLILKEAYRQRQFRVLADVNLFSTNNVGNTPSDEKSDTFYGSRVQFGWQPRLAERWFADLEITQSVFRYDTYDVLDFEVFEANANLTRILPRFGNVIVYAGPRFQYFTNNSFQDELVTITAMRGGIQKIFLLDRRNSIHLGALVNWDLSSDVDEVYRREVSFEAAWRFKIMRDLIFTPSVRQGFYDYTRVARDDTMTVAELNLNWMPKQWMEVTLTGTYVTNDSDIETFDFETTTLGGELGVKFLF